MKLTIDKKQGTFAICDLTSTEVDVILAIVDTTNRRCFREQEESGQWYSNDDFIFVPDRRTAQGTNKGRRRNTANLQQLTKQNNI